MRPFHVGRINWPITLREVEERRPLPPDRLRAREAELLLAALPDGARIVALDERGKALSSPEFAERVRRWRDDGVSDLAFVIGGAEIYAQAIGRAQRVYLTEVHRELPGDTFFPELGKDAGGEWTESARQRNEPETDGGPAFSFVVLDRVG